MRSDDPHTPPHAPPHAPDESQPERQADAPLCDADASLLDRLVEAGFDVEALGPLDANERRRAEILLAHFRLLESYPADESGSDDLVEATMARIAKADEERSERMRIGPSRMVFGRRVRLADFVAVASVALLAITVLVPIANWASGRSLELKCSNNLRLVASGLESYTNDQSALPMVASLFPSALAEWAGYKNSDNLKQLSSLHYCNEHSLCCPGDHDPAGCYAYQVSGGSRRPAWNVGPRMVIVGDRNPLVDLRRHGQIIDSVVLNSDSHGGRGQNLLFTDGSVSFATSPYVADEATGREDNIWLPFGDGAESLLRQPTAEVDLFLLH